MSKCCKKKKSSSGICKQYLSDECSSDDSYSSHIFDYGTDIKKICRKYEVIDNSNNSVGIKIYYMPSNDSFVSQHAHCGAILYATGITDDKYDCENIWLRVKYNGISGYVKLRGDTYILKLIKTIQNKKPHTVLEIKENLQNSDNLPERKIHNDDEQQLFEKNCCICFEKIEERITLISCGHTSICTKCVKGLTDCPICKSKINSYIRIY
jgi:hypothetical protein